MVVEFGTYSATDKSPTVVTATNPKCENVPPLDNINVVFRAIIIG